MPGLLSESDLVVLPSRYNEGVPRILIEAAACGCVPIATRFPGSAALIIPGRTGLFIEGDTPESLAWNLVHLIRELANDDERRRMIGEAAARHIRENGFSEQAVAEAFLELYGLRRKELDTSGK